MSSAVVICSTFVTCFSLVAWLWAVEVASVSVPPTKIPWNINDPANQCRTQRVILELCQRCAKRTKSNIVYPMCCKDQEAAQDWCRAYLSYGRRDQVPHYTIKT